MMSNSNERKIIESLANETAMEMTAHDLEQMLNAELEKPDHEIDAKLVEEILNILEPSEPDPAQMRASWRKAKEYLPHRQAKRRWRKRLMRLTATAAVLAVVMVSTLREAGAFRWTLIQKFLLPVAQTFGIIIDDQTDTTPEATQAPIYSVSDAPSSLATYATLEEVPEMHDGYIIRPKWLPEGFVFSVGSRFTSLDSEIYSFDFTSDEKWFNLHIHITTSDSAVYSQEFERNVDVPIEMTVGNHLVTFYRNASDPDQSAFWIHENAHYMLVGEITVEDIIHFVEQME